MNPKNNQNPFSQENAVSETKARVFFSKRETECALCFLYGATAQSCGEKLGLSQRTVEAYVSTIKKKIAKLTGEHIDKKKMIQFLCSVDLKLICDPAVLGKTNEYKTGQYSICQTSRKAMFKRESFLEHQSMTRRKI